MLSSKLFSLLSFAAAAVAQGFPSGQFFIANVESELVLAVEGGVGGSSPGAFVVLAEQNASDDAQIWSYAEGRGFLTNNASHLVLEVPISYGQVNYGTRLELAEPRNEANDDLTQLWDYDGDAQHLFTLADTNACLAANSSVQYAIVDVCDSQDNDSQQWRFVSV
ncbi:hypothetical protein AGABI2DRAFT_194372 [Agaricus bisporus var. bisporus H97]|uniref:hypothetical protein n=1 Tax=Agaricus bisporus var. bisporus (strain H97 / ATCC MYA-4626 / FGSC 10389) TaxID=936046 RepID=UPI00029F57A3|nr:hypothetical protein AGABI2DRAFT_194372 [Agaricus bisporus var. bisporus H97]EKV45454.1 hypothetical protein AGABI2DRAFT_194372 [Agaricus bisporus var. bisporus H97]